MTWYADGREGGEMKKRLTINLTPADMSDLDFLAKATGQSHSHIVSVGIGVLWEYAETYSPGEAKNPLVAAVMAAVQVKSRNDEEKEKRESKERAVPQKRK
jgi:hypothetical protein